MEEVTVRGEGITLDLLLWRRYGVRGQDLVEATFEANPGLAQQGSELSLGTRVALPALPVNPRPSPPLITLFG
jgi:phage tail protein X